MAKGKSVRLAANVLAAWIALTLGILASGAVVLLLGGLGAALGLSPNWMREANGRTVLAVVCVLFGAACVYPAYRWSRRLMARHWGLA